MALASKLNLNARVAGARPARRAVTVRASRVDQSSKNDIIVSPSILSANFSKLGEEVRQGLQRRTMHCLRVGKGPPHLPPPARGADQGH